MADYWDTSKQSQLHNHLVNSNALVLVRNGSVLYRVYVQQAAEKDKFIQAKLFNIILQHKDFITIKTASISINNFGTVYFSFKIVFFNYSVSLCWKWSYKFPLWLKDYQQFSKFSLCIHIFQLFTFTCAYTWLEQSTLNRQLRGQMDIDSSAEWKS